MTREKHILDYLLKQITKHEQLIEDIDGILPNIKKSISLLEKASKTIANERKILSKERRSSNIMWCCIGAIGMFFILFIISYMT